MKGGPGPTHRLYIAISARWAGYLIAHRRIVRSPPVNEVLINPKQPPPPYINASPQLRRREQRREAEQQPPLRRRLGKARLSADARKRKFFGTRFFEKLFQ
uniref:Uncharacterized protein n=1 Tax=Oryza meridionalis TaxID=40149 RepID=A0A0E0DAQ6_9ORYZ